MGLCLCVCCAGAVGQTDLPLRLTAAGGLELELAVEGVVETFLVDTGASLVTINDALKKRLLAAKRLHRVRTVRGRMADGRIREMTVYRTDALSFGGGCPERDLEVLAVGGNGRNLLGMNALASYESITLGLQPPRISLARCTAEL